MKSLIYLSLFAGLTSFASALTVPVGAPPAGVTVSGTTTVSNLFGIDSYILYPGQSITIDFGGTYTGSFDLLDVDTAGGAPETATLSQDGSAPVVVATGTEIIDNDVAYQSPVTIHFTASTITISNTNTPGAGGFGVANISGTAVPEPTALALVGIGALGILIRRRA